MSKENGRLCVYFDYELLQMYCFKSGMWPHKSCIEIKLLHQDVLITCTTTSHRRFPALLFACDKSAVEHVSGHLFFKLKVVVCSNVFPKIFCILNCLRCPFESVFQLEEEASTGIKRFSSCYF